MSLLRIEPRSGRRYSSTLRSQTLIVLEGVTFTTYFFSHNKMPIDMKMLAFFLGKCVRTTTKTMVLDRKKLEGTSSAIFGVRTAAKCCELKRCVDRVRSRTDNKGEVLEGKFSNLNFSPSTKKTTEYSFQLFLSIYRYLKFFLKFLTSLLSN